MRREPTVESVVGGSVILVLFLGVAVSLLGLGWLVRKLFRS